MNLSDLLACHREEIASAWAARACALPGSRYAEWPFEELVAWARRALDAVMESERSGSAGALTAHASLLSRTRAEQNFEIEQVVEGLLLLGEEALPYIAEVSPNRPGEALKLAVQVQAALRSMAARFAASFASAMREQSEHLAVLDERNRLARDLHDSVSQSLYGVSMYAEAAARLLETGDTKGASEHLREVRDWAGAALKEMRFLIFELRPPMLREEGLVASLRARLSSVERRAGVQADLTADPGERLPLAVEEALYGIAREALNNALRHAAATTVRVRLRRAGQATSIEITDNGSGFDPEAAERAGGLGIPGMRERAARIGATLSIVSRPGAGTTVTAVSTGRQPTAA